MEKEVRRRLQMVGEIEAILDRIETQDEGWFTDRETSIKKLN